MKWYFIVALIRFQNDIDLLYVCCSFLFFFDKYLSTWVFFLILNYIVFWKNSFENLMNCVMFSFLSSSQIIPNSTPAGHSLFSVARIKTMTKATWGWKGLLQLISYSLSWRKVRQGSNSRQELKQRLLRNAAYWLAQPAFFIEPRSTCSGVPPPVRYAIPLPHQWLN